MPSYTRKQFVQVLIIIKTALLKPLHLKFIPLLQIFAIIIDILAFKIRVNIRLN